MKLKLPASATRPVPRDPDSGLWWWVVSGFEKKTGVICGFREEWQAKNYLTELLKDHDTHNRNGKWVPKLKDFEIKLCSQKSGTESEARHDAMTFFKLKSVEVVYR